MNDKILEGCDILDMSKRLDDFVIEFSSLLKERRRKLLNDVFGIDAKKVKSYSENDRGEDRS